MFWKIAIAVTAVTLVGCASDECTRADDKRAECLPSTTSTSGSTSGSTSSGAPSNMITEECSGARLCQSRCIAASTCQEINGNLCRYTSCINSCLAIDGGVPQSCPDAGL